MPLSDEGHKRHITRTLPRKSEKSLQVGDFMSQLSERMGKLPLDSSIVSLYNEVCEKNMAPLTIVDKQGGNDYHTHWEYTTKKAMTPKIIENYIPVADSEAPTREEFGEWELLDPDF